MKSSQREIDIDTHLSEHQHQTQKLNIKDVSLRASVILSGIILLASLNIFYKGRQNLLDPNTCYIDNGHVMTTAINTFFKNNILSLKALMIFASLLVDISIIVTLFFWIFKWVDWTLIYAIILFYGFSVSVLMVHILLK